MNWTEIIGYLVSAITAVAGWWVGRSKQRNDMLKSMQASINLLAEENNKLIQELTSVKRLNLELMIGQTEMQSEIKNLRNENGELRKEIAELNSRLSGVKTITRKK